MTNDVRSLSSNISEFFDSCDLHSISYADLAELYEVVMAARNKLCKEFDYRYAEALVEEKAK